MSALGLTSQVIAKKNPKTVQMASSFAKNIQSMLKRKTSVAGAAGAPALKSEATLAARRPAPPQKKEDTPN